MWRVPRDWPGATVFIVAGGPSVTQEQVDCLKGRHVIAINSSYERAPFADYLIFGDLRWWREHGRRLATFGGKIVFPSRNRAGDGRVLNLEKMKPPGLAGAPTHLTMSRTTLTAAINLAVHLGAKRIVLLGADMCRATDGRSHHHAAHPWPVKPGCWVDQMAELRTTAGPLKALGVEVINASPVSLIDWWPKRSLDEMIGGAA